MANNNLKDNQELQISLKYVDYILTDHSGYCLLGRITKNPKTFLVMFRILRFFFCWGSMQNLIEYNTLWYVIWYNTLGPYHC